MITTFKKVAPVANEVTFQGSNTDFKGTIEKKDNHAVALRGDLKATARCECNRCGKTFAKTLTTRLDLLLIDQVQTVEDLDTIECLDGRIDLGKIVQSETQNLLFDYHYCDSCDSDKEFEITL